MARVNLCPNPASKHNSDDYFGGGARVTGITAMVRETGYQNSNATSTLPRGSGIVPGTTYRFSAYVKGTGGASSGNANINWYSGGNYLSSAPSVPWTVTSGNIVRVESGIRVAPSGADQALLNITGLDATHQVTGVLYSPSDQLSEYFDGDSDDSEWDGADGNSISTTTVGTDTQPSSGGGGGSSDEAGVTQGWGTPLFNEQFNSPLNLSEWGLYDGEGHGGNGTRDPERISVTGGLLRLEGLANGSSAGMAMRVHRRRYGRWEVRMRAYATGGSGSKYHPVLIVWPTGDNWPQDGEYDFVENNIGDTTLGAFLHYPHNPGPVQQIHVTKSGVNIADWHNYAFEWQPSGLRGYVDGVQWFGPLSGGANATRLNIQDMPLGHLTIQLDAFHGDSGYQPARMDVEWVKVYSHTSVSSSTAITGTGIPSAASVSTPLIGNRFRMYLTGDAAGVSPAFATGTWEQTGTAIRRTLGLTRAGSNAAQAVAETSTSNTHDVLQGQWVSPPMTSSGTLKGAFSYAVARSESSSDANMFSRAVLKVVSGDGTVLRGQAADLLVSGTEFTTTLQTILVSSTITSPVVVQTGDRLVFELGYRATNTSATSYTGTIRYGGTAGDTESGDTGSNATTRSAWLGFADPAVEALFRGQTIVPSGVLSSEAFGGALLTQPPTQEIETAGGIATAEAVGSPLVKAEAYPLFPEGFGGEEFGEPSVNQHIVAEGIESAEAVGEPVRVRREFDLFVDEGIPSGEEFGELTFVYDQWLYPDGIESGEEFGLTEVEDPARGFSPFGIPSGAAFGIPTFSYRFRTFGIPSAEAFGVKRLHFRQGRWKLVNPVRTERWRVGGPSNVIYVRNDVAQTVLGTGSVLHTVENPRTEELESAQYVWLGGHANITEDIAIRNLWLANGYDVETVFE